MLHQSLALTLSMPLFASPEPTLYSGLDEDFLQPVVVTEAEAEAILTSWLDTARDLDARLFTMAGYSMFLEEQFIPGIAPQPWREYFRQLQELIDGWPNQLFVEYPGIYSLALEPQTFEVITPFDQSYVIDLPSLAFEYVVPGGEPQFAAGLGAYSPGERFMRARRDLRRLRERRVEILSDLALGELPYYSSPGFYIAGLTAPGTAIERLERTEEQLANIADRLQRMREMAIQAATGSLSQEARDSLNDVFESSIDHLDLLASTDPVHGKLLGTNGELGQSAPLDHNDPIHELPKVVVNPIALGLGVASFDLTSPNNAILALDTLDTAMDSIGLARLSLEGCQQSIATGIKVDFGDQYSLTQP
ncbi:MAG: hypothetical protein AAFZ65_20600 [Planctomycetota bacterium]